MRRGETLADLVADLPVDLAQDHRAFFGGERRSSLSDQSRRLDPDLLDRGGPGLVAVLPDRGAHGAFLRLKPVVAGQEAAVRFRRGLTGSETANGEKAGGKAENVGH